MCVCVSQWGLMGDASLRFRSPQSAVVCYETTGPVPGDEGRAETGVLRSRTSATQLRRLASTMSG